MIFQLTWTIKNAITRDMIIVTTAFGKSALVNEIYWIRARWHSLKRILERSYLQKLKTKIMKFWNISRLRLRLKPQFLGPTFYSTTCYHNAIYFKRLRTYLNWKTWGIKLLIHNYLKKFFNNMITLLEAPEKYHRTKWNLIWSKWTRIS